MTNQSSIKYISSLLDKPELITDGDQSSISLFRQTFPYFVPMRYLGALEAHKKAPFTPQMLSSIRPYMGDWIQFCDFLAAGTRNASDLSAIDKVVDKKNVDIQKQEPVQEQETLVIPLHPPAQTSPVNTEQPRQEIPIPMPEQKTVIPTPVVIPEPAPVPEPVVEPLFSPPPVAASVPEPEPTVAPEPVAAPERVPVAAPEPEQAAAPGPVNEQPLMEIIVEEEAQYQPPPVEAPEEVHQPVARIPFIEIIEEPDHVEPAAEAAPVQEGPPVAAPTPVLVFHEEPVQVIIPPVEEQPLVEQEPVHEAHVEVPVAEATVPLAEPATISAEQAPDTEYYQEPPAAAQPEPEAAPVGEQEASVVEAVEIMSDAEYASAEDTAQAAGEEQLIFPIYTKDYFLQQGEKVSDEIPLEISELRDNSGMSEEDKSLMVMMSFSEWLLHFKNTSEKQREETRDQKALKTMWQKEKLAAAMEEENEEIPETVFEMAVNSISKEESLVSETLAEIHIKQGKYDKAIEMYRKLSLRNPQKSAYFARKIEEALKDKQS